MKLLIITQKVDENDDVLGFFHRWIEEFAKHCEQVTVICLYEGEHNLPENVKVLSLGKEKYIRERCDLKGGVTPTRSLRRSEATEKVRVGVAPQLLTRIKYILRFYKYIWSERKNYDSVFVHMNQIYVILGGVFWRLLRKKIVFWYNHKVGTYATRIAILFSNNVFHTSQFAFPATFKKAKIMPAGIDTETFFRDYSVEKNRYSILFLGRISPVKKLEVFINALKILDKKNIDFTVSVYGNHENSDNEYYKKIRKQAIDLEKKGKIIFQAGIPNTQTPYIYNQHELFVNATPSGSFDKTILEAMACETQVLVCNNSFKGHIPNLDIFKEGNHEDMAIKIQILIEQLEDKKQSLGKSLRNFVTKEHELKNLVHHILYILKNKK